MTFFAAEQMFFYCPVISQDDNLSGRDILCVVFQKIDYSTFMFSLLMTFQMSFE